MLESDRAHISRNAVSFSILIVDEEHMKPVSDVPLLESVAFLWLDALPVTKPKTAGSVTGRKSGHKRSKISLSKQVMTWYWYGIVGFNFLKTL